MSGRQNSGRVDHDTYRDLQDFLFREAAILDGHNYQQWLELLTDDISYQVCAQLNRDAAATPVAYAIIDEDAHRLKARVSQIANPRLTHAENPPTLIRRFVSNLMAETGASADEYRLDSSLLIFRTRPDMPDGGLYSGARSDIVRRVDGELRLARRRVVLDQAILPGTVSTIF